MHLALVASLKKMDAIPLNRADRENVLVFHLPLRTDKARHILELFVFVSGGSPGPFHLLTSTSTLHAPLSKNYLPLSAYRPYSLKFFTGKP